MSESQNKDRRRVDAYRRELDSDPTSLVFVALAEALNRLGEHDEAADVAQRGLQSHKDSVAGRLALAVAEAGRDNIRDALEQIKAALIVDQENPRALALMGSLLLDKGLARRAVQFLGQAVKLAPDTREYADLLRRAKRLAKDESPVELPVVRAENVPDSNPWNDDGTDQDAAAEHTVFDPKSKKVGKLRGPAALRDETSAPNRRASDDELTQFAGVELPREIWDAAEQETAFAARAPNTPPPPKKPKMGGSAAEYSKVAKGADDGRGFEDAEEQTIAAPKDAFLDSIAADAFSDSSGSVADDGEPESTVPSSHVPAAPSRRTVEAPSVRRARGSEDERDQTVDAGLVEAAAAAAAVLDGDTDEGRGKPLTPSKPPSAKGRPSSSVASVDEPPAKSKSSESAPPKKRKSKSAPPPPKKASESKPPPPREVSSTPAPEPPAEEMVAGSGKPSTMFVEDAVWAIYGSEPPPKPKDDDPKKSVERKKKPSAAPAPPQARRRSVLVVRTSAWLGRAALWIVVAMVSAGAMWAAYAYTVEGAGAAPAEAEEALRTIASDLERGGLASMLAAEESITSLLPLVPTLKPTLSAALAEIFARRYTDFGGDIAMRDRARASLAEATGEVTVERLTARVLLSTSAADLDRIDLALVEGLKRYPKSPKSIVLRADIAQRQARSDAAARLLYEARALNPTRRGTLTALARWHASREAYGASIALYDELLAAPEQAEDVEVALERYVVGRLAPTDAGANEIEARLAGLVREELPGVAKDEAGRVALIFAFTAFARSDLATGIDHVSAAEAAFERSSEFRRGTGDLLLGAGEWVRARKQYGKALELDPSNDDLRVAIARAQFGEQSKLRAPKEAATPATTRSVARLPFGTAKLAVDRFTFFSFRPDGNAFPEASYAALAKAHRGPELERQLDALNLRVRAQRAMAEGKTRTAIRLLEEAKTRAPSAALEVALGRAYHRRQDHTAARRAFEVALKLDRDDIAARVGLGKVLADEGSVIDAIATLQPLVDEGVVAPEAYRRLAELHTQRGDDTAALDLLRKVLAAGSADAKLLTQLGRLHHSAGQTDRALDVYRRALSLEPKLKKPPKRRSSRRRSADPRDGVDLYYIGRLMLDGDTKTGTRLLYASAQADESPAEAQFYLGRQLIKKKRTRRAGRRALDAFRKAEPKSELADEAERLLKGR